jgi:hypothetical protein
MSEETLDQISDSELFSKAMAPEAPPAETATEEPVTDTAPAERVRDEKGRFAPKAQEEAAPEVEATQEQPEAEDTKPGFNIPSWRLKEEADHRREAERRAAQLEAMLEQYEQKLKAFEPKPEPTPFPDIFASPEELPNYFNSQIEAVKADYQRELRAAVANMSMQRAHDRHGDAFMEAFQAITARPMDDPIRQQVINSPDPGEALVKAYKREQTLTQVGDDPAAYREKLKAELLTDKDFLAAAIEAVRGQASAQPTNNRIDLPPSLNKAAGSASQSDVGSMSDAHLFRQAMAGKR